MFSAATKTGSQPATSATNYIDDVFSTYLYDGNASTQIINNGIQLGDGYVSGGTGGSGYFPGLSKALSSGFVPVSAGQDFTVECWAYPTTTSGLHVIATPRVGSLSWVLGIYLNNILYYDESAGVFTGTTVPLNTWSHLAFSRQGTTHRLFINGTLVATMTATAQAQTGAALSIGSDNSSSGTAFGATFYGNISNLRVVIGTALYTASFTPPSSALTAVSGTAILCCQSPSPFTDNSSNAFTITGYGGATTSTTGPLPFTFVTGKGGLVWAKSRSNVSGHALFDTVRGGNSLLVSNTTAAAYTGSTYIDPFNSNGFTWAIGDNQVNQSGRTYTSWTFRKQPKFFDIVTFTQSGTSGYQTINHNLGSAPGMILIKGVGQADGWFVYHRSIPTQVTYLNQTNAAANYTLSNSVTSTTFNFNLTDFGYANGATYVAYLFANDAGGFGTSGTDNVISCGSFTHNSSTGSTVNLGYEPQWVLAKRTDASDPWFMVDIMRGMGVSGNTKYLLSNASDAEANYATGFANPTATGIYFPPGAYANGANIIYMAIRRPMKAPTDATTVYKSVTQTAGTNYDITFSGLSYIDHVINFKDTSAGSFNAPIWNDRLRGFPGDMSGSTYANNPGLTSANTDAEGTGTYPPTGGGAGSAANYLSGVTMNRAVWGGGWNGYNGVFHGLKRASGFFDEVCYTGTGSGTSQTHNLGVIPELKIIKSRSGTYDWVVGGSIISGVGGTSDSLILNSTAAVVSNSSYWSAADTSTTFSVRSGNNMSDGSGQTYVAYLFATCPGVSKVGTYTGTSSNQTINCGFTGGARFVLIKRTDSTGDWYVWNTASGMVSGTDQKLKLNSNAAQTNADWVLTTTGGFQIVTPDAGVNYNGGTYIYLAIA